MGWIQNFADLPRAMRALKGSRRLAPGMSRGPPALGGWHGKAGERRGVRCDARSTWPSNSECSLAAGQVIWLLRGSGTLSWALQAWKILLDGDEIHGRQDVFDTPWSRSQAKYTQDFAK